MRVLHVTAVRWCSIIFALRSLERLGRLPSSICICQGGRQHVRGTDADTAQSLQGDLQVQGMQLPHDVLTYSNQPPHPTVRLMQGLAAWGMQTSPVPSAGP